MRTFARALLIVVLVPSTAVAAKYHVNGGKVACTNSNGNGTLGSPFASLYYLMTQGPVVCGDTVELHGGGAYRAAYTQAFNSNASTPAGRYAECDGNEVDDPGGDDTHTVLPMFKSCPSTGPPIIIENYCAGAGSCDDVLLDGTPAFVDTINWQQCTGTSPNASCCGFGSLQLSNPS